MSQLLAAELAEWIDEDDRYGSKDYGTKTSKENCGAKASSKLGKDAKRKKPKKAFKQVDTGFHGLALVQVRDKRVCVVELITQLLKGVSQSKKTQSRFTIKLIPMQVVCYAELSAFEKGARGVLSDLFRSAPSFSCERWRRRWHAGCVHGGSGTSKRQKR